MYKTRVSITRVRHYARAHRYNNLNTLHAKRLCKRSVLHQLEKNKKKKKKSRTMTCGSGFRPGLNF